MLERLKTRRDFVRVAGRQRKAVTPGLILQVAERAARDGRSGDGALCLRVGYTVSRKVGGAVVRNRARRRLRAAAERVLAQNATCGHDYVLIGRRTTPGRPFDALVGDLETALRRLHLYKRARAEERAE